MNCRTISRYQILGQLGAGGIRDASRAVGKSLSRRAVIRVLLKE